MAHLGHSHARAPVRDCFSFSPYACLCTQGCHMLAMWADMDGLSEPWFKAFATWLVNGTTTDGNRTCTM
jgi:hypothetical protein